MVHRIRTRKLKRVSSLFRQQRPRFTFVILFRGGIQIRIARVVELHFRVRLHFTMSIIINVRDLLIGSSDPRIGHQTGRPAVVRLQFLSICEIIQLTRFISFQVNEIAIEEKKKKRHFVFIECAPIIKKDEKRIQFKGYVDVIRGDCLKLSSKRCVRFPIISR